MALRDLNIRPEYRTKLSNISRDFLVPALSESVSYKRAVGFFSSSSLSEVAQGLGRIVATGGKVQLIASPYLSEDDIRAIEDGYRRREDILQDALLRGLQPTDQLNRLEVDRLNLLANLIASGVLDIKIAFAESNSGFGIYHEKVGILTDDRGDVVAYSGSMNESLNAMKENYETVDVFRSWFDAERERVQGKVSAFDSIWADVEPGVTTYDFPEIKDEIKRKYLKSKPNYNDDLLDDHGDTSLHDVFDASRFSQCRCGCPRRPKVDWLSIREYQSKAVSNWVGQNYRGIFSMATGTGKTITALLAITELFERLNGDLTVVITCPYQHLVEQWTDDLELFGIHLVICYSDSSQKNWRQDLKKLFVGKELHAPGAEFICAITTNATLSGDFMQESLARLNGNVLFVADEAHNLGAPSYQKCLDERFAFRIGLSATLDRHHDEEGTEALRNYFGDVCIDYPLEDAIKQGMLSEYMYFPVVVTLTEDEFAEYRQLTTKIGKCFVGKGGGQRSLSEQGKKLALKRARLVAAAENKLEVLREEIEPYTNNDHILIYCGAAQMLDEGQDRTVSSNGDTRQISQVVNMLGNDLGMTISKFTSEEDIKERSILKSEFSLGNLQALAAIKCLDEGVNIPSIRTAFMLASTTNPKEYIQRRGRLLRKSEGKEYAEIFDFVTLPFSTNTAAGQTIDDVRGVYTLVNNEVARGMEFARHALNFADATDVLDDIRESFKLDELKLMLQLSGQDFEEQPWA